MTRIITGTASVDPGGSIVTAWSNTDGVTLSEITAPADSTVVIEGRSNFIKKRLSTTSFELMLPHAGDGGAGLDCAVSALTAGEAQIGTLNARTATVIQQLGVLDANGRGLFYNLIGATGDNDPGPGRMAFNNADPELVTELYLDVLDANEGGRDVSGLIGLWSAGAVLVVRSIASTAYAAFQLNAAPGTPAGYRKVTCLFVGGDGTLAAEPVAIEWRLPGADKDVDATVPNLAGRALYDNAPAEFRVLVENQGGIAYRYVKRSAAAADWSAGARITGASITLDVTEVDDVPYGVPADVTLTPRVGGYDLSFQIPRGMLIEPGATTTLASDQPAAVSFVPVPGGYRLDIAIPRGAPGDISGVTPFWVTRLSSDADAAAARAGLELVKQTSATDVTAGALLINGAHGLGDQLVTTDTEMNNYKTAGIYITPGAMTNAPPGFTSRIILEVGGGTSYASHTAFDTGSGRTATRISLAGGTTWSPWAMTHNDGEVVASYYQAYSLYFSGSAIVPVDDTPPLATEGVQLATITTAPLKSTTSKLRIRFASLVGADTITAAVLWINVNGNPAARTSYGVVRAAGDLLIAAGEYEFTPGSTSAVIVALRAGAQAGNLRLNGLTSRLFGGSTGASLVVEEIRA